MDEQGWSYSSAMDYMYKLIAAEEGIPSTNFDELGLTRRQVQFHRVTQELINIFNANVQNHPPTCPSAVGQYLIEFQLWKILWPHRKFRKFPSQRPVPPESVALKNIDEWFRMMYATAFTPPITEPTPLLVAPQTTPQITTHETVIHSSSSPKKQIPTAPAAMRERPVQRQGRRRSHPYKEHRSQDTPSRPGLQAAQINRQLQKRVLPAPLRFLAVKAIMRERGNNYTPRHGWNRFGLPYYSITCLAPGGYLSFTGPRQHYIRLLEEQVPNFRIMYQKAPRNLFIVWFEYKEKSFELTDDEWDEFRGFWACVKSWADQEGKFIDVFDYMLDYEGDAEAEAVAVHLQKPRFWI